MLIYKGYEIKVSGSQYIVCGMTYQTLTACANAIDRIKAK